MKTILVIAALLTSCMFNAQTNEKKQSTVRIKKVEIINGVEKITDTTYTTDSPLVDCLNNKGEKLEVSELSGDKKEVTKIIMLTDKKNDLDSLEIDVIEGNDKFPEEIKKIIIDAKTEDKNETNKPTKKIVVINKEENISTDPKSSSSEKRVTKNVIIKMDISEPNQAEQKALGKAGEADGKLKVEKMEFSPNPNNGKFNLSFELQNQGNTEITVIDMNGRQVYTEKLQQFKGNYNKSIDISSEAKGIYFIRVQQDNHALIKKIIVD